MYDTPGSTAQPQLTENAMMMRCCRSLGPWTAMVVQPRLLALTFRNALDMDMDSLGREGAFAFTLVAQGPRTS